MSNDHNDRNDNRDTRPKPTRAYDAFAVRNDKEGKGHFHKIGAAFAHKDGKGFDIDTVATPNNGRITLREPKDRLNEVRGGNQNGQKRNRGRGWNRD